MGARDSEFVWIGDCDCEAKYWLKIVIIMPAQLDWAGGLDFQLNHLKEEFTRNQ